MELLHEIAADLDHGKVTSRQLVDEFFAALEAKPQQAQSCFISCDREGAKQQAEHQDQLRKVGRQRSRFAGIPISVKDLFDVQGQVTRAGSVVLADAAAAIRDSDAIAALRGSGLVIAARTNMTEFAYSGLGLNPHYGTPLCVYDKPTGRLPGGSSSGAAVSVAEGFNALSIGSDTGGSCRIPAAYNGTVGYKPSAQRISTAGAYPLSKTLDSIGSMARSVACCAVADAIMAGDWDGEMKAGPGRKLRLGVLRNPYMMAGLDEKVAQDFATALAKLSGAGVELEDVTLNGLDDLPHYLLRGGIVGFEAHVVHQELLARRAADYDPRVSGRIKLAAQTSQADYVALLAARRAMKLGFEAVAHGFDGIICPTVANVAPALSAVHENSEYMRLNGVSLRNAYVVNFVDGCAISLPMHERGSAPTGFMVFGRNGADHAIFGVAQEIAAKIHLLV